MEFNFNSVNKMFESSFQQNWERPALSNYNGMTLCYKDVARRVEELHIMYAECGLKKGDKVAICGKNHANWAVAFISALTYGAVPVPILHEFKSGNIHHLVNHSESKVLFVDDQVWENLNEAEMPGLEAVVQINALKLLESRNPEAYSLQENITALVDRKYPQGFGPQCLSYYEDKADDLAVINYTSGTSGFSKGVMLTYLNLWGNITFARKVHSQMNNRSNIISILPSAHMYGLMFEVLFQLVQGVHIHFLTRLPSPKIILLAMAEIKPDLIISVPLVIEKIYKTMIKPELEKVDFENACRTVPGFEEKFLAGMRTRMVEAFGGRFKEMIIGGAAFNREVEQFLHRMKFPFTVGYGMTECGPIIAYAPWDEARVGSSGKAAPFMEISIDSKDPVAVPGEILCRGANVFSGYYNNPESTKQVFTKDGWFRTGDMGVVDADGYLYIKGRNKCMILGPSGQNIYPEEMESVINNMKYVVDSLVIEDDGGLTALIYPDLHQAELDGMDKDALQKFLEDSMAVTNKEFPNYSKIVKIEIMPEDFERTPKKSIKRYLYQR